MNSPTIAGFYRPLRRLPMLVAMIAGLHALSGRAAADDALKNADDAPIVISGKVEDRDGNSVDGARVIVNVNRLTVEGIAPEERLEQIGSTTTNAEGRFEVHWLKGNRTRRQRFEILASTAAGLLGFAFAKGDANADAKITARPTDTLHGRLIASDGQPIRDARIAPDSVSEKSMHDSTFVLSAALSSFKLPRELRDKWTTTTSNTGDFEIVGVPESEETKVSGTFIWPVRTQARSRSGTVRKAT